MGNFLSFYDVFLFSLVFPAEPVLKRRVQGRIQDFEKGGGGVRVTVKY